MHKYICDPEITWLNMNNDVFSSVEIDSLCFMIFYNFRFSVIPLGEVQTKCIVHDSYFLSFNGCMLREPAQCHVTGMTDALFGIPAERKCLEKGRASPKRNTKVLSCFCRTSATVIHSVEYC